MDLVNETVTDVGLLIGTNVPCCCKPLIVEEIGCQDRGNSLGYLLNSTVNQKTAL